MENWLISPPVAFFVLFVTAYLIARLFSKIAFRPNKHSSGERKSYACGEDTYDNRAQPDYSDFFPFAFFFTIAHVATLIMTTVPAATIGTIAFALLYIAGGAIALNILLRK